MVSIQSRGKVIAMSAFDDFVVLVESTEVVQQLMKGIREEPARFLGDICREYEKTGQPVPDHHLSCVGYLGEASLRALVSTGLVSQQPGNWVSLYTYEPTPEGRKQYEALEADGFYKR